MFRRRRPPPLVLRGTDGDSYAIEATPEQGPGETPSPGPFCMYCAAYDDGNGLWITNGETPCDQDILCKYHPQDYTPREA